MKKDLEAEGATLEIIAPAIGGVKADDGTHIEADHKFEGGPSVLFDAVAILPSKSGAAKLLKNSAVRDFISDAFGHLKFIGWVAAAMPLFVKAGIANDLNSGCIELIGEKDVALFVKTCRNLRSWARESE